MITKTQEEWTQFFNQGDPCSKAAAYGIMRALRPLTPEDTYYENYLAMREKYGAQFYDIYQLMWLIGSQLAPERILEVGTRSGIGLCQLLSAYPDLGVVREIVGIDLFGDWLSPEIVLKNLAHLNLASPAALELIRGRSNEVLPKLIKDGRKFDYCLVDGSHERLDASSDLELCHHLCDTNGLILFDDVSKNPGECGLIDVWEQFADKHRDEYHFFVRLEGKGVAWGVKTA